VSSPRYLHEASLISPRTVQTLREQPGVLLKRIEGLEVAAVEVSFRSF
jgi:hypothetical protein